MRDVGKPITIASIPASWNKAVSARRILAHKPYHGVSIMSDWWNNPPNPEAIWHGLKYFQWQRIGTILQDIAGCFVLCSLLSPAFKSWVTKKLASLELDLSVPQKQIAPIVQAPPSKRKEALIYMACYSIVTLVTAFAISTVEYQDLGTGKWHHLNSITVILISLPLGLVATFVADLAIFVVAMAFLSILLSLFAGRVGVPMLLSWSFRAERFDKTMVIIGFVIFIVGATINLIVS